MKQTGEVHSQNNFRKKILSSKIILSFEHHLATIHPPPSAVTSRTFVFLVVLRLLSSWVEDFQEITQCCTKWDE